MPNKSNPLITDLYQLTMLQAYFNEGMNDLAVFEFFMRRLPENRNFFVAAGLDQVLTFLETLQFSESDLNYLQTLDIFNDDFLAYLKNFSFRGDVFALPEGTIFFPDEPMLQVIAPIPQAQFIESYVINLLHYQTNVASKAIRARMVIPHRYLMDFGMRRAHGGDAALYAARANYIAGFDATSTVIAGKQFGIPLAGTMAHSYVQAHDTEELAFNDFARSLPKNVVLLLDTYDTEQAAAKIPQVAAELARENIAIKGVRIDSGDLGKHAILVRNILNDAGLTHIQIFASGDLDEYKLETLIKSDIPIDGFGVGTKLDTCADTPYLDCAYKLQEYAGEARRKRSEGKSTWPGRKQIYRYVDNHGMMLHDLVTLRGEVINGATPLLESVMQAGKRVGKPIELITTREYCAKQLVKLPERYKLLTTVEHPFPVKISKALKDLAEAVDNKMNIYKI